MRYEFSNVEMHLLGAEWDKNSGKEILQYAVGSLLYMPATNTKIAEEIIEGRWEYLKSMVLDLEDSVGDDMVKRAQKCSYSVIDILYEALEDGRLEVKDLPLIFVRVREQNQMRTIARKLGDKIRVITGFNIPKFDKFNCDGYIEEFKEVLSKAPCDLYMMPIIESKNAMYIQLRMDNLRTINDKLKLIGDNVLNIRVGAADFCSIFGIRRDIESTVYEIDVVAHCLSDIMNMFGKNYVVSAGVWEYFGKEYGQKWDKGLKQELKADKRRGFIGKTAIHPMQLKVIQENYIVSYEEYQDALAILGINNGLIGVKAGFGNNKMNEVKTHSNWARKILGLAQVYGVKAMEE